MPPPTEKFYRPDEIMYFLKQWHRQKSEPSHAFPIPNSKILAKMLNDFSRKNTNASSSSSDGEESAFSELDDGNKSQKS